MPPFGTIHYPLASNSVRGYAWNERSDLAVVKTNETFVGTGTANLPLFGVRPLTASGNVTTVNRPPEEDFDFPIEIGDAWRVTSTLHMTGNARIVIHMPVGVNDIVIDQPLNGDAPLDADYSAAASVVVTLPAGCLHAFR